MLPSCANMGILHDKKRWEGPAQDPDHPDPWTRWRIPRGCPMLLSGHPAGRVGKVSAIPWERDLWVCWSRAAMDGDLGDHGPTLVGPKCFGVGERALRCCQGLDEQGRALGAVPGWCAGSTEPIPLPRLCYREYCQNPFL